METQNERLVRFPELCEIIGLTRSAVYKSMERGDFPKPLKITNKTVAWRMSTIQEWIASREVAA